ncbi:MAG: hypothetical protein QGH29_05015 [Kiritimatiellia bacterium]|jgi:hypothetical protein|nr:hypothetical protein [Kiritimatiellia bacterium]MDP6810825.1 hypothetical protein [Kiritimatiellia bacterium]
MVASSVGTMVVTGMMSAFIWCGRQSTLCTKMAWSQQEAMTTAAQLTLYVRNASEILDIDEVEGTWVDLGFPDGETRRLSYSNAAPLLRDGRMYLQESGGAETIVANGLTEIQDDSGFTTPVFLQTSPKSLRVAYRVSEPASAGGRDANDGQYAACVQFGICLRNSEE